MLLRFPRIFVALVIVSAFRVVRPFELPFKLPDLPKLPSFLRDNSLTSSIINTVENIGGSDEKKPELKDARTLGEALDLSNQIEGAKGLRQRLNGPNAQLLKKLEEMILTSENESLKKQIGEALYDIPENKLPEINNENRETLELSKNIFEFTKSTVDAIAGYKFAAKLVTPIISLAFPVGSLLLAVADSAIPGEESVLIQKLREEMHTEFQRMSATQHTLTNVILSKLMRLDYQNNVHNPLMQLQDDFDIMLKNTSKDLIDSFRDTCKETTPKRIVYHLKGLADDCVLHSDQEAELEAATFGRFRRSVNDIIKKQTKRSVEQDDALFEQLKFESYTAIQRIKNLTDVDEILNSLETKIEQEFSTEVSPSPLQLMQKIHSFLHSATRRHTKRTSTPRSDSCFLAYLIEELKYERQPVFNLLDYIRSDIAKTLVFTGVCMGINGDTLSNVDFLSKNGMSATSNNTHYKKAVMLGTRVEESMNKFNKYVPYKMTYSLVGEKIVVEKILNELSEAPDWPNDKRLLNKIYNQLANNKYGLDLYSEQYLLINKERYLYDMKIICHLPWCIKAEAKGVALIITKSLKDDFSRILKANDWFMANREALSTLDHDQFQSLSLDIIMNKAEEKVGTLTDSQRHHTFILLRQTRYFSNACERDADHMFYYRAGGLRLDYTHIYHRNTLSTEHCAVLQFIFFV